MLYVRHRIAPSPAAVARNYIDAIVSNAGAVPATDLATTGAVAFLQARAKQGAEFDYETRAGASSTSERYDTLVEIRERGGERPGQSVRLRVELVRQTDGGWEVRHVALDD
jgi:hypothetical protein